MTIKINQELSQEDRSYLTYLTFELLDSLDSLIHPYQANVQMEDLNSYLSMIWLDHFDLLVNYFDFNWLSPVHDDIKTIAEQHIEVKRPNGYSVPQITEQERFTLSKAATHLRELNEALSEQA